MRGALVAALALYAGSAAATPPTFTQLVAELGLDESAVRELREGKIHVGFPKEVSDRDIAADVVFLTRRPTKDVAALFAAFTDVTLNVSTRAMHDIVNEVDFAPFTFGAAGVEEIKQWIDARPGDELNLSTAEIAAFKALGKEASPAKVEAQIRRMLIDRWNAYRLHGIAGIQPYAREKGVLRGDEELPPVLRSLLAAPASSPLRARAVIEGYPRRDPSLKESFRWIVYADDKRPWVTLRHRMLVAQGEGSVLFSDREIYVSHGYNQMQAVGGMFAVDGGTLVFYRASTSTEEVAGTGSSMKHSVGRRMMGRQFEAIFERFRARLER